jgi:drug/metabolite transporter (DMT)-like permease
MPLSALALVITAALLHASWNIAAKRAGGNRHLPLLSGLFVVTLWLPLAAWFGLQELAHWSLQAWLMVLASAVVHLLYFQALLKGYRVADLTVVYPVARGSGPLASAVGAVLLLDEAISLAGACGVLAVCGGVFLVAGGPALWHAPDRLRVLAGLRWGGLTGLLIAAYTVLDGYTVKVLLVGPVLLDYMGNLLRLPFLLPSALRDPDGFRQAARQHWRAALAVGALGPAAYTLVLYAMQSAPLSHVAPARELSMLFAALLGGHLLNEGARGWRIAGAACIALGVAALALG